MLHLTQLIQLCFSSSERQSQPLGLIIQFIPLLDQSIDPCISLPEHGFTLGSQCPQLFLQFGVSFVVEVEFRCDLADDVVESVTFILSGFDDGLVVGVHLLVGVWLTHGSILLKTRMTRSPLLLTRLIDLGHDLFHEHLYISLELTESFWCEDHLFHCSAHGFTSLSQSVDHGSELLDGSLVLLDFHLELLSI